MTYPFDDHIGSRKAPTLQAALSGELGLEAAMGRALALRKKINEHQRSTLRLYQEIRDSEEETEARDVPVKQLLDPYMAAGYAIWLRETDVGALANEVAQAAWESTDPPIPPVNEDNS